MATPRALEMTEGDPPSRPAARVSPPISPYLAELVGVAVLLAVGLSAVTIDFAPGSPIPGWIPDGTLRRLVTGTIFAGTGTLIVYSILGRISGAHLNPAMTLAFLRLGKLGPRTAAGYVAAQVTGAIVGAAVARVAWGGLAASINVGATVPGPQGPAVAFAAEAFMTFLLVTLVMRMVANPRLARYTGIAAGVLVAFLVTVEAPISGTSLNPARSFGPALVAGVFTDLWVYLLAPLVGALAAVSFPLRRADRPVPCAKLHHTDEFACHFTDCAYRVGPPELIAAGLDERPEPQPQEIIPWKP